MSNTGGNMIEIVTEVPLPHCERFAASDADLTVQSADGVLFRLHKKYVETTTGGIVLDGFDSQSEIIHLLETAATLEVLFQFIYPARHPGLSSTPFESLAPLAEAAEKYQVYAAMNVCQIRMMNVLPGHAEEVMAYAVKHDYPEIMYIAAPLLLDKPLENVLGEFPPAIAIAWTRYHASWSTCARSAMLSLPDAVKPYTMQKRTQQYQDYNGCYCGQPIDTTVNKILMALAKGVASLKDMDQTASPGMACCGQLAPAIATWRNNVEVSIRGIPDFSTFV